MYLFYFFLFSFLPLSYFLYLFTYLFPLSSLAILLQSVLFFRNAFLLFDCVLISASSPVVTFPFPTRLRLRVLEESIDFVLVCNSRLISFIDPFTTRPMYRKKAARWKVRWRLALTNFSSTKKIFRENSRRSLSSRDDQSERNSFDEKKLREVQSSA